MATIANELHHDPDLCFCSLDPARECSCPCDDCTERRKASLKLLRLTHLTERLRKAGIEAEDFADLMWTVLERTIEDRIEKLTRCELKLALKGIQLRAEVIAASLTGDYR